jgi:hypothetical protein
LDFIDDQSQSDLIGDFRAQKKLPKGSFFRDFTKAFYTCGPFTPA